MGLYEFNGSISLFGELKGLPFFTNLRFWQRFLMFYSLLFKNLQVLQSSKKSLVYRSVRSSLRKAILYIGSIHFCFL
jgi:hypothetical protein